MSNSQRCPLIFYPSNNEKDKLFFYLKMLFVNCGFHIFIQIWHGVKNTESLFKSWARSPFWISLNKEWLNITTVLRRFVYYYLKKSQLAFILANSPPTIAARWITWVGLYFSNRAIVLDSLNTSKYCQFSSKLHLDQIDWIICMK